MAFFQGMSTETLVSIIDLFGSSAELVGVVVIGAWDCTKAMAAYQFELVGVGKVDMAGGRGYGLCVFVFEWCRAVSGLQHSLNACAKER